jgi:small subunit ribosomal protein S6
MCAVDPRVDDEEVASITADVKGLLTAKGGEVIREEQWGRRRLAFEIDKLKEGKYVLLYLAGEEGQIPITQTEFRMGQNDRILRFLTVRTDEDLKRAGLPPPTEAPPPEAEAAVGEASAAAPAAEASAAAPAAEAPSAAPAAEAPTAAPAAEAPTAAPAAEEATAAPAEPGEEPTSETTTGSRSRKPSESADAGEEE